MAHAYATRAMVKSRNDERSLADSISKRAAVFHCTSLPFFPRPCSFDTHPLLGPPGMFVQMSYHIDRVTDNK
jgi:hypothetical protein